MGLFGAILGGGLKGYGDGMLSDAKAKRDAAQKLLEEERADRRAQQGEDRQDNRIKLQGEAQVTTARAVNADKAVYDRENDDRQHKNRVGEIEIGGKVTRENAAYSSSLDEGRAVNNDKRTGGLVEKITVDADGNEVLTFKNGDRKIAGKAGKGAATGMSESDNRAIKTALELSDAENRGGMADPGVREDVKKRLQASGNGHLIPFITGTAPAISRNNPAPEKSVTRPLSKPKNASTDVTKSDTVQPRKVVPYVAGAKQAPDGHFYVPDPKRPGKFLKVE